jgi:hypothetical protein
MSKGQEITDKFSISLSMLCAIHCLALPLILILLPSLAALNLDNEAFHTWMLVAVIPTSIYALTMGCKGHQAYSLLFLGALGLILLILALLLGHEIIGESGEKSLTLLGATFVFIAHWKNISLYQRDKNCAC